MWYREISKGDYLWIANRDRPLSNSTGTLKISDTNLVLLDQFGATAWSTNVKTRSSGSQLVAELLANGNFVLRYDDNNNPQDYLWQRFDYPTYTLLPEMKLGWDKKSNKNRELTSWKSEDDLSKGDYSYKIESHGLPQRFIWKGNLVIHRIDSWNRAGNEEATYSFKAPENKFYSKLRMSYTGTLERSTWPRIPTTRKWTSLWDAPTDICDKYATCGSNSLCDMAMPSKCSCIEGFEPRNEHLWSLRDMKMGCKRKTALSCAGDGFLHLRKLKLPDTKVAILDRGITLKECRKRCHQDCNCTAYANIDTQNSGSDCLIWREDLVDIRIFTVEGQDLYVRLAAADIGDERSISRKPIGLIIAGVTVMVILSFVMFWLWIRKQKRARAIGTTHQVSNTDLMSSERNLLGANEELAIPQIEFQTIVVATNNFLISNKLGEGGFGIVYKGRLPDGREITVKRLSHMSIQETNQFKTEVVLIAKLQHLNLVRILGYCINTEEHILIYEYLENLSLDSYLFGNTQSSKLNWPTRYKIINGIARGLQYLHHDSHSRIIHRDLKASNILLDKDMIPKISDFGMARLIRRDETEVNTRTLVGTFGYMSPEYTRDGIFSMKSDVFSFGVLHLEILTGKMNRKYSNSNGDTSLLSWAWRNYDEGSWREILDPCIVEMSMFQRQEEVVRCLQIGLLCVQERAEDRPAMPPAVVMLESAAAMPRPKPSGYCDLIGRKTFDIGSSSTGQPAKESWTAADITISVIEPR